MKYFPVLMIVTKRGIFDISKALDIVWHDKVIYKLTHNGIMRILLSLLMDFLKK